MLTLNGFCRPRDVVVAVVVQFRSHQILVVPAVQVCARQDVHDLSYIRNTLTRLGRARLPYIQVTLLSSLFPRLSSDKFTLIDHSEAPRLVQELNIMRFADSKPC